MDQITIEAVAKLVNKCADNPYYYRTRRPAANHILDMDTKSYGAVILQLANKINSGEEDFYSLKNLLGICAMNLKEAFDLLNIHYAKS